MKSEWVNCPICGEPDMEKSFHGEENDPVIECTNHECASNGGTNKSALETHGCPIGVNNPELCSAGYCANCAAFLREELAILSLEKMSSELKITAQYQKQLAEKDAKLAKLYKDIAVLVKHGFFEESHKESREALQRLVQTIKTT